MMGAKINRQDFFEMVRDQVKKEIRKKRITMEEFLREEIGIHPNSYNRKWKSQTVTLSDLLKIAEKLDKNLYIELAEENASVKNNQEKPKLVARLKDQIEQQDRIIRTQQKLIELLENQNNVKQYDNNRRAD